MSLGDAMAEWMEHEKVKGEAQTFGHLAPESRCAYHGTILFAYGEYGDIVPIRVSFPLLPDSPWFFDDMQEFIARRAKTEGRIYLFTGTYMKFPSGSYRFSGKVQTIHLKGILACATP